MIITNCKVNHINNPLGYQMNIPVFSYTVEEAEGKHQLGGRIRVALDPEMTELVTDTGWAALNSTAVKTELELKPRTRYYWTAAATSEVEGEEAVSEVHWFETAKQGEAWEASWISENLPEDDTQAPGEEDENQIDSHEADEKNPASGSGSSSGRYPVFHKRFTLTRQTEDQSHSLFSRFGKGKGEAGSGGEFGDARLYISALGLYHVQINGQEVTEEKLTPYCNDYREWIQYQTYDVTDLLQEENEIAITLAPGWYSGRFGFASKPGDGGFYGNRMMTIAELRISHADGTEEVIGTDDSWTITGSHITFAGIYDGERVDDTLPETEAEPAAVCPNPEAPLTARMSLPVYAHETLPAVELITTPAGEKVFDLGQNIAGGFRLLAAVPKGRTVTVQVGEVLQNGCFYRDNLRSARAEYVYVSDGEPHVLEPVFTYYGYRYAKVTGIENLKQEHFCGVAWYSDAPSIGTLETGNAKVNQLLSNISWGQKGNFVDVPTDCPQRDERMGWTGDTQVFAATACYLTDAAAFYRKFLFDLRAGQARLGGMVPFVIPSFGIDQGCSVWGDCAVLLPWTLYQYTGDLSILEESFDSMRAWVDYITRTDGQDGGWGRTFHFGDWLALDAVGHKAETVEGGTDTGYIAYVYYMNSAQIVAQTANLMAANMFDNTAEDSYVHLKEFWDLSEYYKNLSAQIRQYILNEYFTPSGRCAVTTQTGYLLALKFGLTADPEKTLRALLADIKARGGKLATGFTGTPLLLPELSAMGCDREAYDLLLNEEYPGWLYEVNLGATTVWERWNSMEADGSVSSTGMNSFNHYAYGAVGEWMWQTIAGIIPSPEGAGFKQAVLRPIPDPRIGHAKAEYRSASGIYRTEWELLSNDRLHVKAEIPFDCSALLLLPFAPEKEAERKLEAGVFEITYTMQFEEPYGDL